MTTRRSPLQPLAPPSANILNTRYAHITTKSADGYVVMEEQIQEDTQDAGSVVSGLSSLENDADDFEKLMIQNARDERRLNDALHGRVQAFRKARTHPRVGLTIDNLERNNARNDGSAGANGHVKFESPPSSSGSTRSDPAIHAPAGWGRKSRSNRNWMRTITYEEQQQTPVAADDAVHGLDNDQYQQHVDVPRRSVEESPLSRKSSVQGTPRNDRSAEWDLTFELNEASMIASTPYIPRNTALDDIRQREIDSLREQAVTTARLGRIREGSPESARRPRSSSNKSTSNADNGANTNGQSTQGSPSPNKRAHTRTNSWKSIGKSQPVTGTGKENSPVTLFKTTTEIVSVVERGVAVGTQKSPSRPARYRREDSQDLLRRLARVSNTPSPGRVAPQLQTAPTKQESSTSQIMATDTPPTQPSEADVPEAVSEHAVAPQETQPQQAEPEQAREDDEEDPEPPRNAIVEEELEDVDATPMPVERSVLLPKTPVVTGAWVDTPGPRTIRKHLSILRTPPQSPEKKSSHKGKAPEEATEPPAEEALENIAADIIRPQLPSSALQALVQEAKLQNRQSSADYGDSTINSLEDCIASSPIAEVEDDTLQGLELPTATPRNEAERERQKELRHLHSMNDRLRAARTSIRAASQGMKRVEDRVEHSEEIEEGSDRGRGIRHECSFSMWKWFKSFFWDGRLETNRQGTKWQTLGGLTGLSIFLTVFFVWLIGELVAWYVPHSSSKLREEEADQANSTIWCHPSYTNFSPCHYGVCPNAPQFPFVVPTMMYRNIIRPLYSCLTWLGTSMFGIDETVHTTTASAMNRVTTTIGWARTTSTHLAEEVVWSERMAYDEVLQ
jgi:hypothetical protein